MNKGRLFWGSFILGLGVFLLLDRSGMLVLEWGRVWALWPVLLVLTGVSAIAGSSVAGRIVSAVTGLATALFIVAFMNFGHDPSEPRSEEATAMAEAMRPSTKAAGFSLDAGAGTFVIGGGTDRLMEATISSDAWRYSVDRDSTGEQDRVRMWMNDREQHKWRWRFRNTVEVDLNPAPAWDIDIETGASRVDADFRDLVVERLRIASGASAIKVQLGSRAEECTMTLETGASAVRIYIPESVGCDLRLDAGLTMKRLPGFEKRSSTWFETENLSTASRKIHLEIEAGVSSIRVYRVAEGEGLDL